MKYLGDSYTIPEGKAKHRDRVCKTSRTWLGHLLSRIKTTAKKPGKNPKSGPKRDFDLDIDYIADLYEDQRGMCALTGVEMTHEFNDMFSMSIDRIDSSKGHIKGNIQLVCSAINRMKNIYPQKDTADFLEAAAEARHKNARPFYLPKFEDIEPQQFPAKLPEGQQVYIDTETTMNPCSETPLIRPINSILPDEFYTAPAFRVKPQLWGMVSVDDDLMLIDAAEPGHQVWFLFKNANNWEHPWFISDGDVYYPVFPIAAIRNERSNTAPRGMVGVPGEAFWTAQQKQVEEIRPILAIDTTCNSKDYKFDAEDQDMIKFAIKEWIEELDVS